MITVAVLAAEYIFENKNVLWHLWLSLMCHERCVIGNVTLLAAAVP